jgi:Uma2 family endonuclease
MMKLTTPRARGSTMAISERPDTGGDFTPSPWVGQRMTLDEFLALPEEQPPLEYVDGVVRQKVAAKPVHASIVFFLAKALDDLAVRRRLGVVLPDARFVATGWSPVPDILFFRRERLRTRRAPDDFTEPPDLAVEVISPGQTLADEAQKCLDLLESGTVVALLVLPAEEAVFEFRQQRPLRVLRGDDPLPVDDLLPGLGLTVRDIFEAVNWSWLDEEPEDEGQAEEDAASGRSDA